ncbi:uncharacterized protein AAES06_013753 isoform 2-T2 [Glossophaga mutica]
MGAHYTRQNMFVLVQRMLFTDGEEGEEREESINQLYHSNPARAKVAPQNYGKRVSGADSPSNSQRNLGKDEPPGESEKRHGNTRQERRCEERHVWRVLCEDRVRD